MDDQYEVTLVVGEDEEVLRLLDVEVAEPQMMFSEEQLQLAFWMATSSEAQEKLQAMFLVAKSHGGTAIFSIT